MKTKEIKISSFTFIISIKTKDEIEKNWILNIFIRDQQIILRDFNWRKKQINISVKFDHVNKDISKRKSIWSDYSL